MTTEANVLPNIYQRINAVRKAIGYIQKDRSVSTGGGAYRAVSHDAVTALLRDHMIQQGIIVRVNVCEHEFDQKEEGAKQRLFHGTFIVTFVNADNPEDQFSDSYPAHALDNGDKAPGKAISYATKYALLKTFSIETGEDEESRYQTTDFDVVPYLEAIEKCRTIEALKEAYTVAYEASTNAKDKDAQAAVIKVKNKVKSIIEHADSVAGQA